MILTTRQVNELRDAIGVARLTETDDCAEVFDLLRRQSMKLDLWVLLWASARVNVYLLRKAAGNMRVPVTEAAWLSLLGEISALEARDGQDGARS
jgi:hypothetical protein